MSDENPMVSQIRQLFEVGECLSMDTAELFCVVESKEEEKAVIQHENIANGFLVFNPQNRPVFLLAIDKCLLKDIKEGKRCDCAIFDNECFCFVELKLNVYKSSQATDKLRDAREQLGSTIQFFRETFKKVNKDFLGYKLEAYVVMKEHIYPRNRAQRASVPIKFITDYGVPLYETNHKTFGAKGSDK